MNQTDDYDVTLVVSHEKTNVQMKITLNYYILLTSRRQESVNYLGYYSTHEQLMQQIIMEEASAAEKHIECMINKGSIDCRTHILWNKLLSTTPTFQLTYSELFELKELAHVQSLLSLDSRLSPMLTQPMGWYQGLMKTLITKYAERNRIFISPDNCTQHLLILHQRFLNGFVMLTVDTHHQTGDLSVVYRHIPSQEMDISDRDIYSLVEGVVNACCYHLWVTLLS
ncbi:hypothetical protein AAG570_013280 [Ranatra chinensis]|uniref:Uncharacterized protein n=1 Tax=Ranatra chinensis TaxID=642074 RepID=A0ABD0YUU1_9HEMI